MGRPGVAEKCRKTVTHGGGRRPDPGASGGGWPGNFTDVVVLLLPGWHVYSGGGRNRLPWMKLDRPKNGSKRPNSGFRVFGVFSRVLGLKMSVLGLGFYLECKTMFI